MASGASTRFGVPGGTGGDGPDDHLQSARTMFGRDLHLDRGALETAPAGDPASDPITEPIVRQTGAVELPQEQTQAQTDEETQAQTDEQTDAPVRRRIPSHSGKSRFPALARIFGRWRTNGGFEVRDDGYEVDEDTLSVPRERYLRPLAIVVATAAISFFIVVGLMRLRDSAESARGSVTWRAEPAPAGPPPAAAPAPPPPAAAAPAPPARARVIAPQPADTGVPSIAREARLEPAAAAAKRPIAQRRARRPRPVSLDPDSPMPLSF